LQLMCVHEFMYIHVTTCTGGSHVMDSYVDVLNSHSRVLKRCLNSSFLECLPTTVEA